MANWRIIHGLINVFCVLCCAIPLRAERLYPIIPVDSVNKILLSLPTAKPDSILINKLFLLVDYYIQERKRDSCQHFLQMARQFSTSLQYQAGLAQAFCTEGTMLDEWGQTESAQKAFQQGIRMAKNLGDTKLEAYCWYRYGNAIHHNEKQLTDRIQAYSNAKQLYQDLGMKREEAYLLKAIADIHQLQGNAPQALRELQEVVRMYNEVKYPYLHYTYDLFGVVYRTLGNYDEALNYGLQSIRSAQSTKDTLDIELFYSRIGIVYYDLKQYPEAILYFGKALANFEQRHDSYMIRYSAGQIGYILAASGKPAEAVQFYQKTIRNYPPNTDASIFQDGYYLGDFYMAGKNYQQAEKYYLQMLSVEERRDLNDERKISAYRQVGNFYLKTKLYRKANHYLNNALQLANIGTMLTKAELHYLLFQVDSATGQYVNAIHHFQQYKAFTDSIFNETKSKQIASLQIQYETDKKNQDIQLLQKVNEEQQTRLKQRDFQQKAIIAGVVLLLLLLWVSYTRYRQKKKSNQQLQEQQEIIHHKNEILQSLLQEKEQLISHKDQLISEKEWLLKEVHHRVKNNLQIVMTLLYTQATYLRDSSALAAIMESQHRIHAISLIHQKLYQSANMELIHLRGYIHELVDNLKESLDRENSIQFDLDIDPVELDVVHAVPLGLILNEAVTNALKYAFNAHKEKRITISLKETEDDKYYLVIHDNGKGLPADFDPAITSTLGLSMMRGLSRQLAGELEFDNTAGLRISLVFKKVTTDQKNTLSNQQKNAL